MAVLVLCCAAWPAHSRAQETRALELESGSAPALELADPSLLEGESQALEIRIDDADRQLFSAGTIELWRNISANFRISGELLAQIRHGLEEAGEDPGLRLAVLQRYTPLLLEARARLVAMRGIVDGRLGGEGLTQDTERRIYSGWHDDLYRVIAMIDNDVIILDREASFYGGLSSDVYDEAIGSGVTESPMESTFWGGETRKPEPRAEWEYEGQIGYQAGNSTYADNEAWNYEFVETLTAAGGNEYEFFQQYSRDISYVESESWSFGAEQKIKDILWDGDLRLSEEFGLYRDKDDPLNDLQEGEFKLRFDPEWADGRWEADAEYKYQLKVYETFSARSYKLNSGKLKLEHEFSKDLEGEVEGSFDDYNYSIGSDRGNSKTEYGSALDWDVTNDLSIGAEVGLELKNYDVRKDRNHEESSYDIDVDWKADDHSQLSLKYGYTDHNRFYDPGENYEENKSDVRYRRNLSQEFDFDLNWSFRDKQYDLDPLSDTEQTGYGLGMNYNPDEEWNFAYGYDFKDYGYSDPVREYEAIGHRGSAAWRHHNVSLTLDISRSENDYAMDALRNYTRDDYNLDFDYRFDRHSLRVYYGVGYLDQADPASTNDYTETRLGAGWDYELSEDTDLRLSYDFNVRDYDSQPEQEDNRLQALISFRF
ncbi:hypothetical protein KDL44_04030 [bacterium]|nr:hypothetical protein [bacterium]